MSLPSLDRREWQWALKQWLSWSPRLRRKDARADAAALVAGFDDAARHRHHTLSSHYTLDDWPQLCNATEYRENLYLLDVLTQCVPPRAAGSRGLDIGCRSFSHLPALSAFMPGSWTGVELDAHARYWNGYTRRAYGEWMAAQRAQCRFIAGSLLQVEGSYDLISWTLPFVLPEPLAAWGLPSRFFEPLALLRHAQKLLAPGGVMLIINQGEVEAAEQQQLLTACNMAFRPLGQLHSPFSAFRQPRFAVLVQA